MQFLIDEDLPRSTCNLLQRYGHKGVDIVTVKALLGHTKLETTMIYFHLSDSHKRDAVNKLKKSD